MQQVRTRARYFHALPGAAVRFHLRHAPCIFIRKGKPPDRVSYPCALAEQALARQVRIHLWLPARYLTDSFWILTTRATGDLSARKAGTSARSCV